MTFQEELRDRLWKVAGLIGAARAGDLTYVKKAALVGETMEFVAVHMNKVNAEANELDEVIDQKVTLIEALEGELLQERRNNETLIGQLAEAREAVKTCQEALNTLRHEAEVAENKSGSLLAALTYRADRISRLEDETAMLRQLVVITQLRQVFGATAFTEGGGI